MSVMTPPARTNMRRLTTEEFLAQYPRDRRQELVRGRVVELPMPDFVHGIALKWLMHFFAMYELRTRLGRSSVGEVLLRTHSDPDSNRMMDAVWISRARMPEATRGVMKVAPELAVEVKSPDDRKDDIEEKEAEYFAVGVDVVMFVDPEEQFVRLRRIDGTESVLYVGDVVDLDAIMPGFSFKVADLFAD